MNNIPYFQIKYKTTTGKKSVLKRIDSRVKILIAIIVIISSIITAQLSYSLVLLSVTLCFIPLARINLKKLLGSLLPFLPFVLIAVVFRLFNNPGITDGKYELLWSFWILRITPESFEGSLVLAVRFFILVIYLTAMVTTTEYDEFSFGFEQMMRPLGKLGFPAHEISMVINISVKTFSMLIVETNKIVKAQVSRGADFQVSRFRFLKMVRSLFPLLVPVFRLTAERSKNLMDALESRLYNGGKGRTYFRYRVMDKLDYLIFISFVFLYITIPVLDKLTNAVLIGKIIMIFK